MFYTNYFVNEEKKVVVCKLENCAGSLVCDMCEQGYPHHPDLVIADTFIGKAVCAPEDTFDVEIGKKIAYKRAVAKLFTAKYKTAERFLNMQVKGFDQMVTAIHKIKTKCADTVSRKHREITHLTEVNNG